MVKIGLYDYQLSTKKDKKLMVKIGNKIIHFGATGYSHYYDKTGLLPKNLNHGDNTRRASYRARHSAIKLKDGNLAINNPEQPAYHSYNILW